MTKARPLVCGAVFSGLLLTLPLWLEALSYVRVVRLSLVEGAVYVERPGVAAAERGLVNVPLVQGAAVETADGFAEVEFESGAFARLTTDTRLHFTELALRDSGGRVTALSLERGTATFYAHLRSDDTFLVLTPYFQVSVPERAKFRVDVTSTGARLRVFTGEASVDSRAGLVSVSKDRMFEWYESNGQHVLARNTERDSWDEWNDDRDNVVHAPGQQAIPASLSYGLTDLQRYGRWSYLGGFGSVWQPIVSAGWLPFSFGRWIWDWRLGWTWVSFEPWGWLPYHYGSWYYDDRLGWVWVPDFFDAWSPARCFWVQRPGWIGWGPLPPRGRFGGGTPNDPSRPPRGTVAVSEDGFGRGEIGRLADEIPETGGARWRFVDGPRVEPDEFFRRATGSERVPLPGSADTPVGRPVSPQRSEPAPSFGRPSRPSAPPVSEEDPEVRPGRRPVAPPRSQPDEADVARPERVYQPWGPAAPARVNDSERGAGRNSPDGRERPEPRPRATFGPRPAPQEREAPRAAPPPPPRQAAPASRPSMPAPAASPRAPMAPREAPRPAHRPAPPPREQ